MSRPKPTLARAYVTKAWASPEQAQKYVDELHLKKSPKVTITSYNRVVLEWKFQTLHEAKITIAWCKGTEIGLRQRFRDEIDVEHLAKTVLPIDLYTDADQPPVYEQEPQG
jgi:hypothetical protein